MANIIKTNSIFEIYFVKNSNLLICPFNNKEFIKNQLYNSKFFWDYIAFNFTLSLSIFIFFKFIEKNIITKFKELLLKKIINIF